MGIRTADTIADVSGIRSLFVRQMIPRRVQFIPAVEAVEGSTMTIDEIRVRIMDLPVEDRATLARELLLSLDDAQPHEDVDAAWIEEVGRRADAVARGEMRLIDWQDSIARIEAALAERQKL